MSTLGVSAPAPGGPAARSQVVALAWRSLLGTARQPATWMPQLFFPFLLAAVYASQFSKAVELPGFPFEDVTFLDYIFIAGVVQGVAFGAITGGTALALDIESGFIDRLLSSPVSRPVILVGRLGGAMGYALVQTVVLLLVFTLMGADIAGGVPSLLTVLVVAALLALALGSLASAIALRTGSQEVVQSVFPLLFVLVFVSSAFFPVSLMEGWYGEVAAKNPLTWIIDPTRRLVVVGFDAGDAAEATAIVAGFAALSLAVAFGQLRRRMAAT